MVFAVFIQCSEFNFAHLNKDRIFDRLIKLSIVIKQRSMFRLYIITKISRVREIKDILSGTNGDCNIKEKFRSTQNKER